MACSRLGVMLYLDIQNREETTKASYFQQHIRGTAACMNRVMKATTGCGQLSSNDTLFFDTWFSGVKTAEGVNAEGEDFCGPEKTSHKGFCLDMLEKLMKEWLVGSHIFMKSTPRFPGDRPPMDIRYKYIYQKFLGFISTEGAGSTEPGLPYLSCYSEDYYNFFSSCSLSS